MTKLIFIFSLFSFNVANASVTKIHLSYIKDIKSSRRYYESELLKLVLDRTITKYGPYEIKYKFEMHRNRALKELISGGIDIHDAPTRNEWEEKSLPIYIPLLKGLLGYRLLLIREDSAHKFSKIKDTKSLKKLSAGLGSQWSTTKVLEHLDYKVVKGTTYEGLFGMLSSKRYDYFIRGVNEIYGELDIYKKLYPELIIEKSLALYIPMPIYFFVTPHRPKLAERIEYGLRLLISDGSFEKHFLKFHQKYLTKAKLSKRIILKIGNPLLKKSKVFQKESLWYDPLKN